MLHLLAIRSDNALHRFGLFETGSITDNPFSTHEKGLALRIGRMLRWAFRSPEMARSLNIGSRDWLCYCRAQFPFGFCGCERMFFVSRGRGFHVRQIEFDPSSLAIVSSGFVASILGTMWEQAWYR